ncbi:MAG: hypothetical protein K2X47_03370 [Bdellovibrionales bacterium]|nr:hypothetical protein [Bdellovibrionales bacterium]
MKFNVFAIVFLLGIESIASLPNLVLKSVDPKGKTMFLCNVFDDRVEFELNLNSAVRKWKSPLHYDSAIPSVKALFQRAGNVDTNRITTTNYVQNIIRSYWFRKSSEATSYDLIRDIQTTAVKTSFGSEPLMSFIDRSCFQGFDIWNRAANPLRVGAYQSIKKTLKETHRNYPAYTRLFQLKTPSTSRGFKAPKIVGIQVGNQGPSDLIVATHHGNEHGSTAVAMALVDSFARNPIPGRQIFIIPVLNVSGYESILRLEYGIDPNRTYPGPCGSLAPEFALESTKALARFLRQRNIVTAMTLHNSGNTVTFPWGNVKNTPTEVHSEFLRLAAVAAELNESKIGTSSDAVYETLGNFEDYAFWRHGIWSFLFEMGTSAWADEIPKMVSNNVAAVRALLEVAPKERASEHSWRGTCSSQ